MSFIQYEDRDTANGDTVGTDDMDIVQDDYDQPEPSADPSPRARSRSFSEMNQDDDEIAVSPPKIPSPVRPTGRKGRKKLRSPSLGPVEEDMEEEIAQGLDNLDGDNEEENEPEPRPKSALKGTKRPRTADEQTKKKESKRARPQTILPLSGMSKMLFHPLKL